MRRGYSISSIAIIAVIGVAVLAAWMNYQSTAGVKPMERIAGDQSILKANMETVKSISEPTLKHASNAAALAIAENGGTQSIERVWFCNSKRFPPNIYEVIYAMSNETLNNLNAFLDDSTDIFSELNVYVEPYKCAEIYPEMNETCPLGAPPGNYPEKCDGWNLTATGGSISTEEEGSNHQYVGDINSYVDNDRFFWMYYRLNEAELEDPVLMDFDLIFADKTNCTATEENKESCCVSEGNISATFREIKRLGEEKWKGHFDDYVKCTITEDCRDKHSFSVKIECVDTKYKIPGGTNDTGETYLKWVIKEMVTFGCEFPAGCVGAVVLPGPGPTPPPTLSGYKDQNIISDMYFAEASECNSHLKCFDNLNKDTCRPLAEQTTEYNLCFDPNA
ncbi:MAG: hypothetical protein ABIG84_07190 [archaeon]